MKNISVLALIFLTLLSCKEGEENVDKSDSVDKDEEVDKSSLQPLMNIYGSDSIDASGNIVYGEVNETDNASEVDQPSKEDFGYSLGIRPDNAIPNQFGDDSIDAQGNPVYPPRDTIWNEE